MPGNNKWQKFAITNTSNSCRHGTIAVKQHIKI